MALFVLGGAVFLYLYNSASQPLRSRLQVGYDLWLNELKTDQLRSVSIALVSMDPRQPANWRVGSGGVDLSEEQLGRMLRLVREANLFSAGLTFFGRSEDDRPLTLTVAGPGKLFETKLSYDDINAHSAAQVLIKLIQLANQPPEKSGAEADTEASAPDRSSPASR